METGQINPMTGTFNWPRPLYFAFQTSLEPRPLKLTITIDKFDQQK